MKKITFIVFISLAVFFAGSCKKDSESQKTSGPNFRIKEMSHTTPLGSNRTVYSYAGERISTSLVYESYKSGQQNWVESAKSEFQYENNTVTVTEYLNAGGTWLLDYKFTRTFSNNKLIEIIDSRYENDEWVLSYKVTYSYSGNNLVTYDYFEYIYGTGWEQDSRIELSYQNGRCTGFLGYTSLYSVNLEPFWKGTITYSGDKISENIMYIKNDLAEWVQYEKYVYTYSGGRLSTVKNYSWNEVNNAWSQEVSTSQSYEYDANGLLIRESYVNDFNNSVYEYTYETGHGNGKTLFSYPTNVIFGYPEIRKPVTGPLSIDIHGQVNPVH